VDDRFLPAAVRVDAGYPRHPGAGLYVGAAGFGRLTELRRASYTDRMARYLDELTQVPEMLDSRCNDIECGRVKPIVGEDLRQRQEVLLSQQRAQADRPTSQ